MPSEIFIYQNEELEIEAVFWIAGLISWEDGQKGSHESKHALFQGIYHEPIF